MGQIEQGLEQALRTRPVPSSTEARLRFLLATHKGSTRKVAVVLGVSQRTVQRWVTKRPGARRPPGSLHVRAIEEAVLARWQPRVRPVGVHKPKLTGSSSTPGRDSGSPRQQGRRTIRGCGGSPRTCQERSPGAVRRPGRRRRRAAADGDPGPGAGTRSLSRSGPPGPRSACLFQRRRVR
ncbi:helix-turn-helix domain-containing protein [Streptomyces cynarae]|uniref:Helix-turn-helix domain-containing protein n=1 Tax=Streptomyces cynarae TaxID=2981134 RepID=A0ABY6DSK2_9ACTN|nr:helix-turn-helix domain-containing protein [Streptomyces cynarae]UXY17354.1 helix-turn-helix domain-containing protein [Streptomyces cynarae]